MIAVTRVRIPALAGVVAVGLTLCLPGGVFAQRTEGSFDRTLKVTGPVDLDVRTGSGTIDVRPGSTGAVRVVGRIRASESWAAGGLSAAEKVKRLEAQPPIQQSGNTITVGRIEDEALRNNVSISYEITVPAQCKVRSNTGSGDQLLGDLDGPVEVRSGSGDIRVGSIGGRVDAEAGSGTIEISAARGDLHARAGSGSITAREVKGAIDISTGSGNVEVAQSGPGDVRVSVASGDARLRGIQGGLRVSGASGSIYVEGTPSTAWELHTASGDITLVVPGTASFDLDAESSSGRIDSKHPVTMTGTIGRHALAGKVRGGGPLIRLRTASGSITIQ